MKNKKIYLAAIASALLLSSCGQATSAPAEETKIQTAAEQDTTDAASNKTDIASNEKNTAPDTEDEAATGDKIDAKDKAATGDKDDTTGKTNTGDKAGAADATAASDTTKNAKRKIIIDTDTGADDSSAIILAAKDPDIEIVGVTVMMGNATLDQSAGNALMALELAGCDAPVYKGASKTFNGQEKEVSHVFGSDGMGEMDLIHPSRTPEQKDAVDFMIDSVRENPGEIEIVALAPATNIAKAIAKDPETMKQVKRIWSLGTTGTGSGNVTPVAEFNVFLDAEAYKVMLDSGLPVTVIGLDMCGGDAMWTDEQFQKLEATNEIGKFVTGSFTKLREFYASNGSVGKVMNPDTVAMLCALYPDYVKDETSTHASCITDPGETFGQVIFYKEGFHYESAIDDFQYNATLVSDVDRKKGFERYLEAVK